MTTLPAEWWSVTGPADGQRLVMIHGAMDRAAGMAKLARRLDGSSLVFRFDRRGYGRRIDHPGPFTVAGNIDDVVELLGGDPAVLIGHSLGGVIALAAAAAHPSLVAGVVAFEPPMPWTPWWPTTTAGAAALAADASPAEAAEQFMRRLIGDARWEGLPQRTREVRRREGTALVAELEDLLRIPFTPAQVECPVVVGVSDHPRPHHHRGTAELAASLPDAELVVLDNCHHDAHSSVAGQFAERLVEPLLRRLSAP